MSLTTFQNNGKIKLRSTKEGNRMSEIVVKEVLSKRQMREFVQFPLDLYKNEPKYIPAFFGDEMKLFDKKKSVYSDISKTRFFLCYKDGVLAGRIAGIVLYPYLEKSGRKIIRFSRIDFIDDFAVSEALFKAVEDFARAEGLSEIQGPMGYSDLDREGLLVDGFEYESTFAAAYTYDYFPKHLDRLGYVKEVDWLEYLLFLPDVPNEKISRIADMVGKRFKLREAVDGSMNVPKIVDRYADKIFALLNETYAHLHGTIPFTEKIMNDVIVQFKLFLIPEFFSVVVDEKDDIIGFGLVLSSISEELVRCRGRLTPRSVLRLLRLKNHPKTAELALIGVIPEYMKKGVNAMIINKITQGLLSKGVKIVETNLELETNSSVISMWEGVDKKQTKRRRCYLKELN